MKLKKAETEYVFSGRFLTALLPLALFALSGDSAAADFSFKPLIAVSEEYTDNVFLTGQGKKSDYITRTKPGFISRYNAPLWEWDINYAYDYRYYVNGSRKNDNSQNVNAKGLIKIVDESLFLELSDIYSRVSLDSVRDTTSESLFVNQTDRNIATVSPYAVFRPSADSILKTGYRYINTIFSGTVATNIISHVGFLNGSYEATAKLSFNLDYSYTRQERTNMQINRHDVYFGPRFEYADKSFIFAQGGQVLPTSAIIRIISSNRSGKPALTTHLIQCCLSSRPKSFIWITRSAHRT